MKRVAFGALVALLFFHTTSIRAADPTDPDARILRLERWIKAALAHHPGERDDASAEAALWSEQQLRVLRIDEALLVRMLRRPGLKITPTVTTVRDIPPYTAWQIRRFTELADEFRGRNVHEGIIVRGALLHGDIAMSNPPTPFAPDPRPNESSRLKINIGDGESIGFAGVSLHWDLARVLFDAVKDDKVAADTARRWYIATSMLMQQQEQHDTVHLKHGREVFPDDVDLQFLSGCQQETYASAAVQAAARNAVLPQGYYVDVPSEASALRAAEDFFRRALTLNPKHQEARMHLGHILVLRGRPQEAAAELRQVAFADDDMESRYFAAMFLGAAEEGSGRVDEAREAYLRAAGIYPGAQSPYLALSALAMRHGDRKGALSEIGHVMELSQAVERHSTDAWWVYRVTHTRHTDDLFEAVYTPLRDTVK